MKVYIKSVWYFSYLFCGFKLISTLLVLHIFIWTRIFTVKVSKCLKFYNKKLVADYKNVHWVKFIFHICSWSFYNNIWSSFVLWQVNWQKFHPNSFCCWSFFWSDCHQLTFRFEKSKVCCYFSYVYIQYQRCMYYFYKILVAFIGGSYESILFLIVSQFLGGFGAYSLIPLTYTILSDLCSDRYRQMGVVFVNSAW